MWCGGLDDFFKRRNLLFQLLSLFFLFGRIEGKHGAFVGSIGVLGVVKDGEEPKVLFLRDRVVFVVVALGACHGCAHPDGHRGVDAIDNGHVAILLVVGTTLVVRQRVSMKRGRDEILFRCLRQEVTGDLLERELIKRLVRVQRTDDIIAIGPNRARWIVGIAAGICVTGLIQPQPRPVFAEGSLGQKSVHTSLVSSR